MVGRGAGRQTGIERVVWRGQEFSLPSFYVGLVPPKGLCIPGVILEGFEVGPFSMAFHYPGKGRTPCVFVLDASLLQKGRPRETVY